MRPPEIGTARLLLRPIRPGDVGALHAYRSEPEWARYLPGLPQPYTLADAERDVDEYVGLDAATHAFWGIEYEGRLIGNIDAELETPFRALIGYGIARSHWGQGLTTEAAQAVVGWAFSHPAVVRVYAEADERNAGSRRVMEKLGMQHEGTLRCHRDDRGVPANHVLYAVLRSEWSALDQHRDRGA